MTFYIKIYTLTNNINIYDKDKIIIASQSINRKLNAVFSYSENNYDKYNNSKHKTVLKYKLTKLLAIIYNINIEELIKINEEKLLHKSLSGL